jgi:hypothetical protein
MSDPGNEIIPAYQEPFRLAENDKQSGTWGKLSAHLKDRLETLRRQNDGERLTDIQTAVIRGKIAILKELCALEEEPPRTDG